MKLGLIFLTLPLAASCVACTGAGASAGTRTYTAVAAGEPPAGPSVPPVYVHLAAARGAVLQRLSPRDDDWKDVCTAPCDGWVPAYGSYRVSTHDREPTDAFTLPGPPGTSVALAADDDGKVWTRDSVDLRAHRAGAV